MALELHLYRRGEFPLFPAVLGRVPESERGSEAERGRAYAARGRKRAAGVGADVAQHVGGAGGRGWDAARAWRATDLSPAAARSAGVHRRVRCVQLCLLSGADLVADVSFHDAAPR